MKPFGWRFESHRHALAARGVKTNTYMAGKISKMATPSHADITAIDNSRKEHLNEMVKAEEDRDFERMHSEYERAIHTGQELSGAIQDRRYSKASLRHIRGGEQPLSLIKAIDPKVTNLRARDTENIRDFDEMHSSGTDYAEIKDVMADMVVEYEDMGMSHTAATRRARSILQKSKAFEDALSTTDDPDEFLSRKNTLGEDGKDPEFTVTFTERGKPIHYLDGIPLTDDEVPKAIKKFGQPEHDEHYALKDNLAWFTGEKTEDQSKWSFGDSRDVQSQKVDAFNAYASDPAEFEKTPYFAKKVPKKCGQCGKWHDHLHGGKADKMQPWMFNQKELKRGTKHEMEHTTNKKIAQEISMDHLAEDKAYYKKLEKVEKV